jgi:uncharacterized SAM-binding protein YcdF (DUF218 family)
MQTILAALVDMTATMLKISFTVAGVIMAWFMVLYALGMVFLGVYAWLKAKRRQNALNALRVHRGPTIDL